MASVPKYSGEGTPFKKYTMESPNEQNLSVQRVGSLLPASVGSERAGLMTSLSCDRNVLEMGHLAALAQQVQN